jgi:hypothetical protein
MAMPDWPTAASGLRVMISDYPQLNTLDQDYETTDSELIMYLQDTLIEINKEVEPVTFWDLPDIIVNPGDSGYISWNTIKRGAILKYLMAKGILNARNLLTYSDTGGITVADRDRWGRYMNFFNSLAAGYTNGVRAQKLRLNIASAYGGFHSPLSFDIY